MLIHQVFLSPKIRNQEIALGNIKKIIFAHDTVRVVECLMAVGSEDIRDKMFVELKDDVLGNICKK